MLRRNFVMSVGASSVPLLPVDSASSVPAASSERPVVPAAPASLNTRASATGNAEPTSPVRSALPSPEPTPIAGSRSLNDRVFPGAMLYASDGSLDDPVVACVWKMILPDTATLLELYNCNDVLKNEPKLPGVEPTTAKNFAVGACATAVMSTDTDVDGDDVRSHPAAWLRARTR